MKRSALLRFESSFFDIAPEEDERTRPGVFGKTLAEWLSAKLETRRVSVGEIIAEDFGWCIPIAVPGYRLYVACASVPNHPNEWKVFAFAEGRFLTRVLGRDESGKAVASMLATLKQILDAAFQVNNLREEPL